jgi:hypothetical protein
MLQVVEQLTRPRFLSYIGDPDLGQALVWRQLTGCAAEVLALDASGNAFRGQRISPQSGDGEVGAWVRRGMLRSSIRGMQTNASKRMQS